MRQEIVMPQLGLTMTEGAVAAWMKKPGDQIDRGEILFLVQTDKVEMEVESFVSGHLDSILVEPEVLVKVGTVIATVEDGRPGPKETVKQEVVEKVSVKREVPVSPRARKLAASLSVDLASISPSNGTRIVEEDIRRFHEGSPKPTPPSSARNVIAERMTLSFQSAPHFYLTAHVDVSKLVELRNTSVDLFQQRHGVKVTYTDFFVRAMAIALQENPDVNSFWNRDRSERRKAIDVAIATQTAHGLLTPVVRNADKLNFGELAKQRSALVEKARSRKLTLNEMEGGSATLSNLGTHKIDEFHAILNPPQSVILATGQIAKRPMVVGDKVEARSTVFLTLSSPHRIMRSTFPQDGYKS